MPIKRRYRELNVKPTPVFRLKKIYYAIRATRVSGKFPSVNVIRQIKAYIAALKKKPDSEIIYKNFRQVSTSNRT